MEKIIVLPESSSLNGVRYFFVWDHGNLVIYDGSTCPSANSGLRPIRDKFSTFDLSGTSYVENPALDGTGNRGISGCG